MKKLIILLSLLTISSCQSYLKQEAEKTLKANGASNRINSSDSNNIDLFKELDE